MLDKQQLISSISTSSLRMTALQERERENNLAPQLENKMQRERARRCCFHAIFDLCLHFDWTQGHVSLSFSFFLPAFPPPSYFHFILIPLLVGMLPVAPTSTLYFRSHKGRKHSHTCTKNSTRVLHLRKSVKPNLQHPHPLTPPLVFFFFCPGFRGYQPTIPQPINPSDSTILIVSLIVLSQNNNSHKAKILIVGFSCHSRSSACEREY